VDDRDTIRLRLPDKEFANIETIQQKNAAAFIH
jgi:hypothetical protein